MLPITSSLRISVLAAVLLALVASSGFAIDYNRQQIIAALTDLPAADAHQNPQTPLVAPAEKDPYLLSLQKIATDKPDPELIQDLLIYQFAYRSPDNPTPARVLGKIYLEQPDAVLAVYYKMPAAQRVVLMPYLVFGYDKAIEGKNKSLPRLVACQKKLDHLQADLMNARSRDDSH